LKLSFFILHQCSKQFLWLLKLMPRGSHYRDISDKDTTFHQNMSRYLLTDTV